MSERTYELISSLPDAVTPLSGTEYCEVEQGGVSRKVPYSVLGGVPSAHAASHQNGGSDEIATADRIANAIPKTDGAGTLNAFMDTATETIPGIVTLAGNSEESNNPPKSSDPRMKNARTPITHAASHLGGSDDLGLGTAAFENIDVPGGIPLTDSNNKLLTKYLPPLSISEVFVVASQAAMLALTAERGDVAVRTDLNNTAFILSTDDQTTLANWIQLSAGTYVVTVDGQSGVISLKNKYIGQWVADSYMSGAWVWYGAKLYIARSSTLSTEVPVESDVWVAVNLGGGNVNIGYNFTAGQIGDGILEWTGYKDAAQSTPVDGTGGTVTTGHTFVKNETAPIIGSADALWSKPAANCQGEGFSAPLTIDEGVRDGPAQVTFSFRTPETGYADGDAGIYIYDVTNGVVITGSLSEIPNTYGKASRYSFNFIPSTSSQYRVCLHVRTTSATAYGIRIANIQVGSRMITQGAAISDPITVTPIVSGLGAGGLSSAYLKWNRAGSKCNINFNILKDGTAGVGSEVVRVSIPGNISTIGISQSVIVGNGIANIDSSNIVPVVFYIDNGSIIAFNTTSQQFITGAKLKATDGNIQGNLSFEVPAWAGSGTVGLVQGYEEYASNDGSGGTAANTRYSTGMKKGSEGSNIVSITSDSSTPENTCYLVTFDNDIQSTDSLSIEVSIMNGKWTPLFPYLEYMVQGSYRYGVELEPHDTLKNSVWMVFGNSGAYPKGTTYAQFGQAWSGISSYKLRVRKTSAGKPGETLPLVRAALKGHAAQSTIGSAVAFNTTPKDTHAITNASRNRFTFAVAGVASIKACIVCSTGTIIGLYKNGTKESDFIYQTSSGNAHAFGGNDVDVVAGDYIEIKLEVGSVISDNLAYLKITLLGR